METRRFGYLAEFRTPSQLLAAAESTYEAGYRTIEAYSPFPIHGLAEATGFRKTILPWLVFGGGLTGTLTGFGLQYWASAVNYPLNVGGRPLASWPSFVIVSFELTILFAAASAAIGMLLLNGLPHPYHPLFNVRRFERRASRNGFFLAISALDEQFDVEQTRAFMEELEGARVTEVFE